MLGYFLLTDFNRPEIILQPTNIEQALRAKKKVPNTIQQCPKSRDLIAPTQSSMQLQLHKICVSVWSLICVWDCVYVCMPAHEQAYTQVPQTFRKF